MRIAVTYGNAGTKTLTQASNRVAVKYGSAGTTTKTESSSTVSPNTRVAVKYGTTGTTTVTNSTDKSARVPVSYTDSAKPTTEAKSGTKLDAIA
jgi:hypothetical protein